MHHTSVLKRGGTQGGSEAARVASVAMHPCRSEGSVRVLRQVLSCHSNFISRHLSSSEACQSNVRAAQFGVLNLAFVPFIEVLRTCGSTTHLWIRGLAWGGKLGQLTEFQPNPEKNSVSPKKKKKVKISAKKSDFLWGAARAFATGRSWANFA